MGGIYNDQSLLNSKDIPRIIESEKKNYEFHCHTLKGYQSIH